MAGVDAFEVLGVIGEGAFGKVTKVKRKSDGEIMVWKELNYGKMSEKEKQLLVSEVRPAGPWLTLPLATVGPDPVFACAGEYSSRAQ